MLVFREAKTMPVQQIVVNPVTLQQTNNKDRKVSFASNTTSVFSIAFETLVFTYLAGEIRCEFLTPIAFVYLRWNDWISKEHGVF